MGSIHALHRCMCSARPVEPSMDRYRARNAKPDHEDADADDSDELGVFAAERYFYGDNAPWCERSSSSLSSAFRTATHEHDRSLPTPTAVTSSSEASWNSRSALLPADKLHAVVVAAAAAAPIVEARPSGSGAESEPAGRRPASSSSNLRRWLLGVASCACAGGAAEESVSADEMEASERFPETENQVAALEEAAAARVAPASGRWLLEGDQTLPGMEAFSSPIQLAVDGHRRATYRPAELFTPILHPGAAPTSDSDERRRITSLESFRKVPVAVCDHGSALGSSMQSSAFTIVAGNTALGGDDPLAASGGRGSHGEDDAAPSELGCAYPPSEASVVWSVVTADGAASGNFSSAASGYYYHYYFDDVDDGATRRGATKSTHKRRSGIATSSSLLTCMSEKAVDAVRPDRSVHRQEVQSVAMATLGAAGGNRNVHGGGVYNRQAYQDVIRRR